MILQPCLFLDVIGHVVGTTDIKDVQVKGRMTKILDLMLEDLELVEFFFIFVLTTYIDVFLIIILSLIKIIL
jgi:hypothetical protein